MSTTTQPGIFKWVEGEKLGDSFLLKERLGKGTYGVVGKAMRLKDGPSLREGDVVALKVPFDQEIGWENLIREPEILSQFSHENIVKVYGYLSISGFFVIEMEYVEGHSLADILNNQSFGNQQSLITIINWIKQIVHALKSMGIYSHGDIKPQNILIRDDGIVKLVDFGTSRRLEDVWVFTRGQGTEQYMAPEVALDNKRISTKSDLYSLGVILYEVTTGDIPFHSNLERLQGRSLTKPREINSSVPIHLEKVILKCLERDPDLRYGDWDAFLGDLEIALESIRQVDREPVIVPETQRYQFKPEPSSPLYYLDKAKKALVDEDYNEALKNAEAAVDASEGHPNYLRMLAAVSLRSHYYSKAKDAFNRLLEKYDHGYPVETEQLAYVLQKLGELYIKLQEYDAAIQTWQRFFNVTEHKTLAKFKLSIAYGLDGDYNKSIELLEEVREEVPDSVVIYCKLGWAYALAGDYQQSISYYNQALVIDPSDLFSLFELGKYYRIKGDNRRTKKYFDRIEKNDRSGEYVIKVEELYG
jgi:eukaryotic-like serine/threonine-protein kinase